MSKLLGIVACVWLMGCTQSPKEREEARQRAAIESDLRMLQHYHTVDMRQEMEAGRLPYGQIVHVDDTAGARARARAVAMLPRGLEDGAWAGQSGYLQGWTVIQQTAWHTEGNYTTVCSHPRVEIALRRIVCH